MMETKPMTVGELIEKPYICEDCGDNMMLEITPTERPILCTDCSQEWAQELMEQKRLGFGNW